MKHSAGKSAKNAMAISIIQSKCLHEVDRTIRREHTLDKVITQPEMLRPDVGNMPRLSVV
eukprot:CAMPEP_0172562912 /NCGR_PEP_ID=MMETSP1067-20121228/98913_1 /TAXON_ID=265564 ORGANISM="Thalassiosira punctigera, Strain Tpunct2005C2" /NCGR_SAMPLE_ID=MMETSP1067 /ASSEMBLY_ACC=CAM_ASM_000444 /LENGTH=59 /DNA_ID=CAMNT_0013353237 /DNA_START=360 /DNA_END=536 /DNA_ORIENTATION=-